MNNASDVGSCDEGTKIDDLDNGALAANSAHYFATLASAGEDIAVAKDKNFISPLLEGLLDSPSNCVI